MTFPCTYVLYPELVHPLHFSPFYLSPPLLVISADIKILAEHRWLTPVILATRNADRDQEDYGLKPAQAK
jgi:hypothetical protein